MRRLVYMANQIGAFFIVQKPERVVPGIAKHIKDFWDPRMRARMENHIATTGGEGLQPHVLEALKSLPPVARQDVSIPEDRAPAAHH